MINPNISISLIYVTLLIVTTSSQNTLTLTNATIQFPLAEITTLLQNTSYDNCGQMQLHGSHLYHLSLTGEIQIFWKGNISNRISMVNQSALAINQMYFDVSYNQNQLIILSHQVGNHSILHYSVVNGIPSYSNTTPLTIAPNSIFRNGSQSYHYYKAVSGDYLIKLNNNVPEGTYNFTHANSSIAFTPDFTLALTWTSTTQVFIYQTTNFTLLSIFNDSINTSKLYATNHINISPDSTIAIIQADEGWVNMLNLITFQLDSCLYSYHNITGTPFITNDIVMILCTDQTILWQLSVNAQPHLSGYNYSIRASSYWIDWVQLSLYTCFQNQIKKYMVNYTSTVVGVFNTTNTTNTTNATNTTNYGMPNASSQNMGLDGEWTFSINMTQKQQQIYEQISTVFAASQTTISSVFIFAMSTPLTYYFLSFINFINLHSLYILLSINMPTQLYDILTLAYQTSNANLLQITGITLNPPSYSRQRVTDPKNVQLGITSDFISSNYLILLLSAISLLLSEGIILMSKLWKLKPLFVQWVFAQRVKIFSGQIIKVILPSTLPWKYVLFGGTMSSLDKINIVLWYIFFFVAVFFHFLYLFILTEQNKQKLKISKNNKNNKNNNLLITNNKLLLTNNKLLLTNNNILLTNNNVLLTNLFAHDILQQFYICLSNFIYPFFIIFSNPLFFLISITIYSLIGVYLSSKKHKWKLNNIILSLYPIIFHCSIIVIYSSTDDYNLGNACIVCLITLLIGCFHQMAMIIIEGVVVGWRYFKARPKDRIVPEEEKTNKKLCIFVGNSNKKKTHLVRNKQRQNKMKELQNYVSTPKPLILNFPTKNALKQKLAFKIVRKHQQHLQIKSIAQHIIAKHTQHRNAQNAQHRNAQNAQHRNAQNTQNINAKHAQHINAKHAQHIIAKHAQHIIAKHGKPKTELSFNAHKSLK